MSDRFVEEDLRSLDGEGPLMVLERDELSAVGTGNFLGQLLVLMLAESSDGAFGHTASGGSGDLLHGLKVKLCLGTGLLDGTTRGNFSPVVGKGLDFTELFVSKDRLSHDQSGQEVTKKMLRDFHSSL